MISCIHWVSLLVHLHTLDLDMDDVMTVLDVVLNLTAIHSCVTGTQLRYPDASISWASRISRQLNSVPVVLRDTHPSLQGNEDSWDIFFGDEAPFDAMRQRRDGGSSRVFNSVVLRKRKPFHHQLVSWLHLCFHNMWQSWFGKLM